MRLGIITFVLCGLLTALSVHAATTTTTLAANGGTSTYTLIESVLGSGTASETPDCAHPEFGPHITQSWDSTLGKYIFNFFIHVSPDNDRCLVDITDRQRNEIKTMGGSPAAVVAYQGDITSYRWFFKLDSGFQPSPNFTHIHQIKAVNGVDDSMPLITIAPRAGSPEKLEILYAPPKEFGGNQSPVASAPLSGFKGEWIEANERMLNSSNGTYQIVLKRVSDGVVLLSYTNNDIIMWRGGNSSAINRPKWGIYRSLLSSNYLRDEVVKFADFSITKGDETPASITTSPTNLTVTAGQNATFTVAAAGVAPLYYRWRFNTTNNLLWATNATMILTNMQRTNAGGYAVVVSNLYGSVTSAVATLTVGNVTPSVSLTAPANTARFQEPASIALTADASDVDGTITTVDFYNGSTRLGSDDSSPYAYTWTNVAAGSHNLTARATDNDGAVSTSAAAAVTVNAAPGVDLTSPANGASFTVPASITMTADAFDDGTITMVDFYNGSTLLESDTSWPYAYTWMNVVDGSYNLTARATDNDGAVSRSAVAAITVVRPIYTLTVGAGAKGRIAPTSANVRAGNSTNFVITASNYYRIATLTTNGAAVTGMSFDNNSTNYTYIWSNVQTSGVLAATFTAQVTTNAPAQVPYSWMGSYFVTNDYDAAANADQDSDGLKAWQEYITGTVPTNKASCFTAAQSNRNVISWSPVTGRVYSVYWSTNLMKGFQPLETNIVYPQSSYTNATPDFRVNHYQIKVRMQ